MHASRSLLALLCGSAWLLAGLGLAAEPQSNWDDQPTASAGEATPRADQPPPKLDQPPPANREGRRPPKGAAQPFDGRKPEGWRPDAAGPFRGGRSDMPGMEGMPGGMPGSVPGAPGMMGGPGMPGAPGGMMGGPGMENMPTMGPPGMHPGFFGGRDSRHFEELKKYDPEMYELEKSDADLERQTFELTQRFRATPRDQQEAVKKQIAEVVEKHFDVRQARRQLQLKRLQEELEQLRTAIDRRNQIRAAIIDRRVGELTGKTSDVDF